MQHIVTIRANRNKIAGWIELISFANAGDRYKVMDVDETISYFTISLLKIETTDSTATPFGSVTNFTCPTIALRS